MAQVKTYAWNWEGGGYNSCQATSKKQAIEKAKELGDSDLVVIKSSVRVVSSEGLKALRLEYFPDNPPVVWSPIPR